MTPKKAKFSLTGILIENKGQAGYTAYFAEFPEAIADGSTVEEAHNNLMEAFNILLETRKLESYQVDRSSGGIIQQKFEFELA